MSITYKTLRNGGLALAGVGLVGVTVDGYAKALDPLVDDKFGTFVLHTTASNAAVYGVRQVQDTVTGDVFEVTEPDRRGDVATTDISSGSNLIQLGTSDWWRNS